MKIKIVVYKATGKYYTEGIVESGNDIPLFKDEFKEFVKNNLPAKIGGGYVTVEDMEDNQSFHQALYLYNEL